MPTTLNQYTLGRTLGTGVSCKVKLAKDSSNARYAIKIIHSDEAFQELIDTECEALTALQHPNIVRLVEVSRGMQSNPRKGEKQVNYIVLELVGGGELFDFVSLGGRLSEAQARYYYTQLIDGLSYMHAEGKAHRDLKPENLILDAAFTLKISDFGFAAPLEGRDGSGLLQTQLGTASYMAPEIHLGKPYEGARVDLFASAIILFVILTQRPPFATANPQDPHYRLLAANRAELFWTAHADAEDGQDLYSADFKDFFQKMMALNPKQRLTMDQVRSHPWMQGEMPSYEEIKTDFTRRKQLVDEEAHRDREEKRAQRHKTATSKDGKSRRGPEQDAEDGETENPREQWSLLEVQDYGPFFVQDYTQFFTTANPLDFFEELNDHLTKEGLMAQISGDSLALKFEATLPIRATEAANNGEEEKKAEEETGRKAQVKVQVLRVEDNKCCVKFSYRDLTSKLDLAKASDVNQHFKSLRDHMDLRVFNDATFDEQTAQ